MSSRKLRTIQVVYKKSTYEIYIEKYRDPRLISLLEADDPSVEWISSSHEENQAALAHVRAVLKKRNIRNRWSYRARREPLEGVDLVLAVGGDGTLLEAARMVSDGTPVLGLRSTPSQSVGYLSAGDAFACEELLDHYISGTLPLLEVTRLAIEHNGELLALSALNDVLFAHESPAATSRYSITQWGPSGPSETATHRSSGLWVATATGSTAAIHSAGGAPMLISDERIQFAVRELYSSNRQDPKLVQGFLGSQEVLELRSHMRRAFLFFDGPWVKRPVYFGDTLRFRSAHTPLVLVAPGRSQ